MALADRRIDFSQPGLLEGVHEGAVGADQRMLAGRVLPLGHHADEEEVIQLRRGHRQRALPKPAISPMPVHPNRFRPIRQIHTTDQNTPTHTKTHSTPNS